jgi:integrase
MPGWVKNVVDQWIQAANITSGKLFRRVHKMGKTWGEKLTEKAVWHVVRQHAVKADIHKLAPHDLRRTCARLCYAAGGELEQSSFCSVTFRFRQQKNISVANSGFRVPSTTKSE